MKRLVVADKNYHERCLCCQVTYCNCTYSIAVSVIVTKTVLSCGVNRTGDKTRQFCLLSTQFPICNCSVSNILKTTKTWKLETESRQDKTILFCLQLCSHHRHEQGNTRQFLSCPCRPCEQAITRTHILTMLVYYTSHRLSGRNKLTI